MAAATTHCKVTSVLRKLRSAIEPLYAAFNADQKKTADELMIGPMGIMGMRMM